MNSPRTINPGILPIAVRGGSYVGDSFLSSSATTWPFSVLEISSNSLVVTISGLFSSRYEFPREAIRQLVLRSTRIFALVGLDTANLQIIHGLPNVPRYIVFAALHGEKLRIALQAAGFKYSSNLGKEFQIKFRPTAKLIVSAVGGGTAAAILGLLFRFRLLPFLKSELIVSGGKQVRTTDFAMSASTILFCGATICFLSALALLLMHIRERRRTSGAVGK